MTTRSCIRRPSPLSGLPGVRRTGAALGIAALVRCAATVGAADALLVVTVPQQRIVIEASADGSARLWRLAMLCSEQVRDMLRTDVVPAATVRLRLVEKPSAPPASAPALELPVDAPDATVAHHLSVALLLRQARAGRAAFAPAPGALDWLAAAAAHAVFLPPGGGVRATPDYQPARQVFNDGVFPQVAALLTRPLLPEDGPAYRLYSLHVRLLAQMINTDVPGGVARILDLQAGGREPVEAMRFVLHPAFEPREDLQSWYERQAASMARQGRRPSSHGEIARRFEDMLQIQVMLPGHLGAGPMRVPLEELPTTLPATAMASLGLQALQHNLFELIKDAPPLMQEPLLECLRIVQELGKGKTRGAARELRRMRTRFDEAKARQAALTLFLDTYAGSVQSVDERFALYLDATRRAQARRQRLDPGLDAYLRAMSP